LTSPKLYRVHSRDAFGPVYHVQILNGIAICNCPGYSNNGHCWHQGEGLKMNEREDPPETMALVPIQVNPPEAALPSVQEINIMALIAGRAAKAEGLVPKAIQTEDQAFAVMLAGWEVGAKPMTALRHIFVVNGRTEPDAQLMMGIVRAKDSSARFVFHTRTTQVCDVELWRRGRSIVRIQYSLQDAKTSGQLAKGGPWHLYPADMLSWAAVKRACRLGAPDLINAISGVDVGEAEDMMAGLAEEVTGVEVNVLPPAALVNEGDEGAGEPQVEPAPVEEEPEPVPEGEMPKLRNLGDLYTQAHELLGYPNRAAVLAALGCRETDIADLPAAWRKLEAAAK
jgi:hypothetical protein